MELKERQLTIKFCFLAGEVDFYKKYIHNKIFYI